MILVVASLEMVAGLPCYQPAGRQKIYNETVLLNDKLMLMPNSMPSFPNPPPPYALCPMPYALCLMPKEVQPFNSYLVYMNE